jgi:hypothetical protein
MIKIQKIQQTISLECHDTSEMNLSTTEIGTQCQMKSTKV